MDNLNNINKILMDEIDIPDRYEDNDDLYLDVDQVIQKATSGGLAAEIGIKTENLQAAINEYANALNQSAIAKSTGQPVRTPVQQYKGFAAEEYFKQTLKINALAEGIPDYRIGVYTKGAMPDGTTLSGIDMETDISVWTRKHFWSRPEEIAQYQSKIHNDAAAYSKDINNPQYQNVKFVGGADQGVNDTIKIKISDKSIESDSITPQAAKQLAEDMKEQKTPEYGNAKEKFNELNNINIQNAIKLGAVTGCILTTIQEVVDAIKHSKDLSEDQFIKSIKNIMCGSIEGGVRGGAIAGSVQVLSKLLGREIAANSVGAIPAMTAANVAVDLAKDLYKCFVTQTIDLDDLLCNSVSNAFTSAAGFGGACLVGKIGGKIAEDFSSCMFAEGIAGISSARTATAIGASIGSSLGPIGTIIGSVVGGVIIGVGAGAIKNAANKDAATAFNECIQKVNSEMELCGFDKLYYFADSMSCLSDFRLSFKDLMPCYNLISDLREYSLRKKALSEVSKQLDPTFGKLAEEEKKAFLQLENMHRKRLNQLYQQFEEQKVLLQQQFRQAVDNYISDSYTKYLISYAEMHMKSEDLALDLERNINIHSSILESMSFRNEANQSLNDTLVELLQDTESKKLLGPFINQITHFMQEDEMLVGRQYITQDEVERLIGGTAL